MSYTYNDATMTIAAQLAYLDFEEGQNVGERVQQIYETYHQQNADGTWSLRPEFENGNMTGDQDWEYGLVCKLMELDNNTGGEVDWRSWNVRDVCNDQDDTGYYGMMLDPGNGHPIITNRGSECTASTAYKDWVEADVGLFDHELTAQQQAAQEYMDRIWHQYGNEYDSFSLTGHSLGGNLATHMAITAPAALREKIEHCLSLDGPGYSQEYIDAHREDIAKINDRIDHYQWSVVSSLLNPLPGVKDTVIEAHNEETAGNILTAMFLRHSMDNVHFDEQGNVKEGDQSLLSYIGGPLSRFLDEFSIAELSGAALLAKLASLGLGSTALATLSGAFVVLAGIRLIVQALSNLREVVQKINTLKNNIYYNFIAPQVSGDYEVNMTSVGNMAQEIYKAETRLQSISDEIEDIRKNLKYFSATGGYYRSVLFGLRTGLEIDLMKLKAMAGIAEKAATRYKNVDTKVADSFA